MHHLCLTSQGRAGVPSLDFISVPRRSRREPSKRIKWLYSLRDANGQETTNLTSGEMVNYLKETAKTDKTPQHVLSLSLRGQVEVEAEIWYEQDRWRAKASGQVPGAAVAASPLGSTRKKKAFKVSLEEEIKDEDYVVEATEEQRGNMAGWSFKVSNMNLKPLCKHRIGSVTHLRRLLQSDDSDQSLPLRLITSWLALSTNKGVTKKVGVYSRKNGKWKITGERHEGFLEFGSGLDETQCGRVVYSLPDSVRKSLNTTNPASEPHELHSWRIETSAVKGMWSHTVTDKNGV